MHQIKIWSAVIIKYCKNYFNLLFLLTSLLAGWLINNNHNPNLAKWLMAIVGAGLVIPIIVRSWNKFRINAIDFDLITIVSVILAIVVVQDYTALIILAVYYLKDYIFKFISQQLKTTFDNYKNQLTKKYTVLKAKKTVQVNLTDIHINDILILKTASIVPCDGHITKGQAEINNSLINTNPASLKVSVGDKILAGQKIIKGQIELKVNKIAEDSELLSIYGYLTRRQFNYQTPLTKKLAKYSLIISLSIFILAVVVRQISHSTLRALDILTVANTFPLIVLPSYGYLLMTKKAFKQRLIIKSNADLEQIASSNSLVIPGSDLLVSDFKLAKINILDKKYSQAKVLEMLVNLEQNIDQPIAKTIVDYGISQKVKLTKLKKVNYSLSQGIKAIYKGDNLLLGSANFMANNGIKLTKTSTTSYKQLAQTIYLAKNNQLLAEVSLTFNIQDSFNKIIQKLRDLDLKIVLLTSANEKLCTLIGQKSAIKTIYSEAYLNEKIIIAQDEVSPRPASTIIHNHEDSLIANNLDSSISFDVPATHDEAQQAQINVLGNDFMAIYRLFKLLFTTSLINKINSLLSISLIFVLVTIYSLGLLPTTLGPILQLAVFIVSLAWPAIIINKSLKNTD